MWVKMTYCHPTDQGWQTFSAKGQMVNIIGFAGYKVLVATTQFCLCSHREYVNESNKTSSMDTETWISNNFYVSQNIIFFLIFFQPSKSAKCILSSQAI